MKATLKSLQQARALYEEGAELRQQRLSEEATERFLQALTLMHGCDPTTENLRLEGQLKDNLGAMYNKHGLFDDALKMHCEAIECFRQINDSTAVMTTMRNCGRVAKSLEQFAQAKPIRPCRATSTLRWAATTTCPWAIIPKP